MQANNEINIQNQKMLIKREFQLVLEGKNAYKLINILEKHEFESNYEPLQEEEKFMMKIVYLINHEHRRLKGFLKRNFEEASRLFVIAKYGCEENLFLYVLEIKKILVELEYKCCKEIIEKAIMKFVIKTTAKYYLNIEVNFLCELLECTSETIENEGYVIKNKYIQFINEEEKYKINKENLNNTLKEKMKELVEVTKMMSELE